MMQQINLKTLSLIYIIAILFAAWLVGCGGSSNPILDEDSGNPTVQIEATNVNVRAGEQVRLTAKVQSAPKGAKILYAWSVVDGAGHLDEAAVQSSVTWTAPNSMTPGEVQLSIIQVTVTLISQEFRENGSKTIIEKEIESIIRSVPITIVG